MDLWVLDRDLNEISVVDEYKSITWKDRYCGYGDFELYTPISVSFLDLFRQDYYLYSKDSEHLMIIDQILIESDTENGTSLAISGKSLESILNRRIVWGQFTMEGNLQNAIEELLNISIIDPSDADRKIENFIFERSTDPLVTELIVSAQYTGDNVYEVIQKLCNEHDIGFKITLNDAKQFVFKLYAGVDRSYEQTAHPFVMFSPEYDNLVDSNYIESKANFKNVTLVGGEDTTSGGYSETANDTGITAYISSDGTVRKYVTVGSASGLDRRELFTDARDIQSEVDGATISETEYSNLLKQRGKEKLAETADITAFEGSIEPNGMFKLGVDYTIGDIVQIANEYGHTSKVRILEIVSSNDESGTKITPTFETIKEEGEL